MTIEIIVNIDLATDGDWAFTDELRKAYFEEMFEDGGFEGRIAIFDNVDDAILCIENVLTQTVEGGIFRHPDRAFDSDHYYLDGISRVLEFYTETEFRDTIANDIAESVATDNLNERLGGVEIFTECGNWSSKTALYLRIDGRISSNVAPYWLPND